MNRTTLGRGLALTLSVGILVALVFQACSSSAPAPEAVVAAEPPISPPASAATPGASALGASAEGKAPSAPALPASAEEAQLQAPPDYMGASKAAPVFHPHPTPQQAVPEQAAPPQPANAPRKNAAP